MYLQGSCMRSVNVRYQPSNHVVCDDLESPWQVISAAANVSKAMLISLTDHCIRAMRRNSLAIEDSVLK